MSIASTTAKHPDQPIADETHFKQDTLPIVESSFFFWKGIFDRIAAALLLLPALPIIGLLVILIRLTSRGPGIYSQVRVGRGGRNYTMHKLRSMRCDAEARTGPAWTQGGSDPRITPIGRWLRKLHLDELPQLFNVLRGEMSLVGPRPERPEFVNVLKEAIPNYEHRLAILPGITGLAQINLPPDTDVDSVRRKQTLDLQYAREATLWFDLRILTATAMRIVGIPGSVAAWAARVERIVTLPDPEETVSDAHAQDLSDTTTLKTLVQQLQEESANGNGHHADNGRGPHGKSHAVVDDSHELSRRHPK